MIKILLILSSVMLIATAIFGVLNRQLFLDERDTKNQAKEDWKVVNRDLIQTQEKLQDTQEDLKTAKDDRDENDAKLTIAKDKLAQKERAVTELMATLEEEKLNLKEIDVILAKYKDPLTGQLIKIEDLKTRKEGMAADLTNKRAELETLEGKVAAANAAVDANESTIEGHIRNQAARSSSFERNSFEATITAVNNDWGFVIIDAGQDAGLTADSPLLVSSADGRRVGKLNIISIEPTVTVADIDRDSLVSGAVIQPGDRVVYEKTAE